MTRPRLNATWENLATPARSALTEWKHRIDENDTHQGLWVVAERAGGSSYVANVAMRKMVYDNTWSWEWLQAKDLINAKRAQWSAAEAVRFHPNDYDLWQEGNQIDLELNFLWEEADIICIDDLHAVLDIPFWRKHLQPDLEGRVKAGRPVVVATDMIPSHSEIRDIERVIQTLFVVCDARR